MALICRSISAAPRSLVLAPASRSRNCPNASTAAAMLRRRRAAIDRPTVAKPVTVAGIGSVPDQLPGWYVGLDPLAKFLVFQPRSRQHGDKAAADAVDVIHVLA